MNQAILAAAAAFGFAVLAGPGTIRYLYRLKYGQQVRADGPQSHKKKQGTPTMGGVLILAAVAFATLIFAAEFHLVVYALFTTLGFALIGLIDDVIKVVAKRSLGLRARQKAVAQLLVAVVPSLVALSEWGPVWLIPFTGTEWSMHPILFVLASIATLFASANAVNITDGLDGLAAGATAIAATVYAVIAASLGHPELSVFAAAVAGACLGFAWFNSHPAQVFMGDTGSMALGAALGTLAILTRTPLLLAIIGGLFVIETLSVILQVFYFRVSKGRRIFRMSPLHHHFELVGWAEPKVVTRFWLIALLCGLVGLLAI